MSLVEVVCKLGMKVSKWQNPLFFFCAKAFLQVLSHLAGALEMSSFFLIPASTLWKWRKGW